MADMNSVLDNLRASINTEEIAKNEAYYLGKNPTILKEKNKKKPDNKIPVAYGYRLISNLSGFAARTGDIYIDQKPVDGEDTGQSDFEKMRNDIDKDNNALLLNSQLYIQTLKQGISYDVVWTEANEEGELAIKFAQIPNTQAVPIWDDELATVKKLSGFVRFWDDTIKVGVDGLPVADMTAGKETTVSYAQVFKVGSYSIWRKVGNGDWAMDGEEVPQPFDIIQVSAYRGNMEAKPYIEPVTVLIDQVDKVISRNMNEVERFNNSLLAVLKKITPEVKGKVDEIGVIDNLIAGLEANPNDSVFPKFITRDIPTEHANMMIKTLSTMIYEKMGAPNFTAESFGTASGIALIYRLIGLEYSAAETDVWYDQGILNRNELINQALRVTENNQNIDEGFEPVVVHKRNTPVDLSFIADNAIKIKSLGISDEIMLKLFPKSIIGDIQKELDRMETQTEPVELERPTIPAE